MSPDGVALFGDGVSGGGGGGGLLLGDGVNGGGGGGVVVKAIALSTYL